MTQPPRPPRPSPQRKSGEPMPVLLNVLVTLLALGCLVGAAGGFWVFRSFQEAADPVRRAAQRYASHLRAGDWAGAYQQTCAATRRAMTEQEFVAAQEAEPKASDYEVVETNRGDHSGRRVATLTLRITYPDGEVRTRELPLVDEGVWRPCP